MAHLVLIGIAETTSYRLVSSLLRYAVRPVSALLETDRTWVRLILSFGTVGVVSNLLRLLTTPTVPKPQVCLGCLGTPLFSSVFAPATGPRKSSFLDPPDRGTDAEPAFHPSHPATRGVPAGYVKVLHKRAIVRRYAWDSIEQEDKRSMKFVTQLPRIQLPSPLLSLSQIC